jgi:hypothetical protein
MSSATIRKRITAKGEARYIVTYRRGGRSYRIETAGTFKTQRDAKTRRDVVAGWLAQGLDPKVELAKTAAPAPETLTVAEWASRYESSRIDFADETTKNVRSHVKKIAASSIATKPAVEARVGETVHRDAAADLRLRSR